MALSTYSRRIVLALTNNTSTTVMMTVFQLRNTYVGSIAFQFQHEIKLIRGSIRAQHDIVNVYLHSPINCMIYPQLWVQTARVTNTESVIVISDINITTHISLLLFEIPLKSSDLYRISPNTLSSFEWWNSSAQLAILDRLSIKFLRTEMLASYTKTSLDVSAAYGNDIPALQRHTVDI